MADTTVRSVRDVLARYSAGDDGALADLIATEFFTHVPMADEPTAPEVFAEFATGFRAACPDLAIDIPDLTETDDGTLQGTAVVTGTRTGPLWGVAPSEKRHSFEIPVRLRPVEGHFAVNLDLTPPMALAILRELGLVNPPDEMHLPPPEGADVPEVAMKVLFTGTIADRPCTHLADARVTQTDRLLCDDCGDDQRWPAVRLCLTCGHVGCCDTSTNKHAKVHWEQTGHPLMRSLRLNDGWIWCYADDAMFERRQLERIEARLAAGG